MDEQREIADLLREIRDLQRTHLDLYQNVTARLLESAQQQEQDRRRRDETIQADLGKSTRKVWIWFAILLMAIFFLRPLGDRLVRLFDR